MHAADQMPGAAALGQEILHREARRREFPAECVSVSAHSCPSVPAVRYSAPFIDRGAGGDGLELFVGRRRDRRERVAAITGGGSRADVGHEAHAQIAPEAERGG